MLKIEEAFNILEEEYKKQKILSNKIHAIKEINKNKYIIDIGKVLEILRGEDNE